MLFSMPGTTESVLHEFMVNTLKQNNLWLNSNKIAVKRKNEVGFVENSNSDYTHYKETAAKIEAAIIKLTIIDSTAAALYSKIKGEKFIQCTSKRIYQSKVTREGIAILTTNNNYGPVVRLLKMLPQNSILQYYVVRSKMMKKAMNPESYDKLILRHQGEVNKQGYIVPMNVGVDFYEIQVNFVKNTPNSMTLSIRKFLYGQGKCLAIEPTSDTKDLGKYIMIVNNNNYSHTSKKLRNY